MICPKCKTLNEEGALFCLNCEANLINRTTAVKSNKTTDLLIITFLAILFLSEIVRFAIEKFVDNWYEGFAKYIIIAINLIAGFSVLLLGFSIKNNNLKTIGVLVSIVYAIYIIYLNINWIGVG